MSMIRSYPEKQVRAFSFLFFFFPCIEVSREQSCDAPHMANTPEEFQIKWAFPLDFLKVRPAADTCSQFANQLLFKEQDADVISKRKVFQKRTDTVLVFEHCNGWHD